MMEVGFTWLFFLGTPLFLSLSGNAHAMASQFPCHANKTALGQDVLCEGVSLPHDLCSSCKLKGFDPNSGAFLDCASIYDLDEPSCQSSLRRYAALNQCDIIRNQQVSNFSNASNKQGLDYFVYSICEECCDCVPRGVTALDYDSRAMQRNLLSARRGNCAAHARFDICKVLPRVRFFKLEGSGDYDEFPYACPMLEDWFQTNSTDWLNRGWVPMDDRLERFLKTMYWAAKCGVKETWQRCASLESAQHRL